MHFVTVLRHSLEVTAGTGNTADSSQICVRALTKTDIPEAIETLARACRTVGGSLAKGYCPANPSAEIVSRPGRQVLAWMAFVTGQGGRQQPAGLVTLVIAESRNGKRSSGGDDRRFSIGLLLVDPQHRRSGIGTMLASQAVAEAGRQGARQVEVETLADWSAAEFWQAFRKR